MGFRGDRLRDLREKREYSLEGLGKKFGLTKYQMHRYETGASDPASTLISEFADFFGVTTDYLHGRDDTIPDDKYDSLSDITEYLQKLGMKDMGFFDIEKWKNLSPDNVEEIKKHFDYVVFKAMQEKKK